MYTNQNKSNKWRFDMILITLIAGLLLGILLGQWTNLWVPLLIFLGVILLVTLYSFWVVSGYNFVTMRLPNTDEIFPIPQNVYEKIILCLYKNGELVFTFFAGMLLGNIISFYS